MSHVADTTLDDQQKLELEAIEIKLLTEGIFRAFDDPGYRHPNRPEVSPIAFELAHNALRSALERRRISLPAELVPDSVWEGLQQALSSG